MGIANLKPLMYLVMLMVGVDALGVPAILVMTQLAPAFFATQVSPAVDQIDAAMLGFKLLTMIAFAVWIYRAGRNLIRLGYEDLSFTPGARIWWFAIPFANLVQPYFGMRELWNASHGKDQYDETVPTVAIWWGLWLANGFMGVILRIFVGAEGLTVLWVQGAIDLALAFAAIQLVRGITLAQRSLRGPELSAVFA